MATDDEINAAFDAIQSQLRALISKLPYFEQGTALSALTSQEGRQDQVNIIRAALTAAEGVRAKPGPTKASSPR